MTTRWIIEELWLLPGWQNSPEDAFPWWQVCLLHVATCSLSDSRALPALCVQFQEETDPARKVPCNCGARNCRRWMC
jgi:hypothetical protein